jgi:Domain of unknown function (DUF4189)
MLMRLHSLLFVILAIIACSPQVSAKEVCTSYVVGFGPSVLSTDEYGNPSYSEQPPIYDTKCVDLYGAVAIDPVTRKFSASWGHETIQKAKDYVTNQCGQSCITSVVEGDYAYIALSDDDRFSGISLISSDDAESKCQASGGTECSTVIRGKSTSEPMYWDFGVLAYDKTTGTKSSSGGYKRKSEAQKAALPNCNTADCQLYVYQSSYGAIAMAKDGTFFNGWSDKDQKSAGKDAEKKCKKEGRKKSCRAVVTGSSFPASASKK